MIRGPLGRAGMDTHFVANYYEAGAAGFRRGMYALWRPEWGAWEQANHFVITYDQYAWELPPACDFEIAAGDGRNLASEIRAYLLLIEAELGIRPVVYTGASWWNPHVGFTSWAKDYRLWAAGYPDPQHTMKRPGQWWPGYAPLGWPGTFPYWWQFGTMPGEDYGVQSEFVDMNWMTL